MDHQNPFPFVLSRLLPHSPAAVFAAWTEPQALAAWWGPASHQTLVQQLDLRPGGFFHYCHQGPDGAQLWGRFEYLDISAPAQLSFINAFSDENRGLVPAPFGMPWPTEMYNVLSLSTEENGHCRMTLQARAHHATPEEEANYLAMVGSMVQSFGQTFDRLEGYLGLGGSGIPGLR
ncbi:SRPBCC domain-containing protein [Haliscomenobacter sp.]|uniref:SRPBCC family protein n=1 Tax=Haliscomenobacter sp. TaxID=2717303 RepID=UPI00359396EB